ncbi:PilN domain-containing protein [Patescibacteria group bacterium]
MANINLHQSVERSESLKKKPSFFASRTWISVLLIVISCSAYAGLKYYQFSLEQTKQSLIDAKQQEMLSMDKEMIREVVDFRNKTKGIEYNIENKTNPNVNFSQMEKLLLSDVYLDKYVYSYEDRGIELAVVADDFESIAEQMWNFKKSKEFASVEIENSSLNEEGKTVFTLKLKMN